MPNNPKTLPPEQRPTSESSQQPQEAQTSSPTNGSWGDRWKQTAFKSGTYFGLNYVVNTLASVALAYVFELKYDHKLKSVSQNIGKKVASVTGFSAEKQGEAFYHGTKGLTLTMGGTMLLPVIKGLEDHRHSLEFKIGHGLDVMQDKLGMGNQSTQENLAEYQAIKTAVKTGKPVEGLSDEAMGLIGKQHNLNVDCDGKLSFKEKKLPWGHVFTARLVAWGAAFGTNYSLSQVGLGKALNDAQGRVTELMTKVTPAYKKLKQPDVFSKNLANDSVLCVSSALTQPFIQKVLSNKAARKEAFAENDCPPRGQASSDNAAWATAKVESLKKKPQEQPAASHLAAVETSRKNASEQQSLA